MTHDRPEGEFQDALRQHSTEQLQNLSRIAAQGHAVEEARQAIRQELASEVRGRFDELALFFEENDIPMDGATTVPESPKGRFSRKKPEPEKDVWILRGHGTQKPLSGHTKLGLTAKRSLVKWKDSDGPKAEPKPVTDDDLIPLAHLAVVAAPGSPSVEARNRQLVTTWEKRILDWATEKKPTAKSPTS